MGSVERSDSNEAEPGESIDTQLRSVYYNLDSPYGYSTERALFKALKGRVKLDVIREWLRGQMAYTLHKARRVNFKRNAYKLNNINIQWQGDLIDTSSVALENDNHNFVLLVIDSFSKFVSTRALKNKSAREVTAAFKDIVEERGVKPMYFVTDKGKEFVNSTLGAYMKSEKIIHFSPANDTFKASIAERAIRSWKSLVYKIMTATMSMRFIDHLEKVTRMMNGRHHRTIGMCPAEVNEKNIYDVWRNSRLASSKAEGKPTKESMKIGDFVRLSKNKNTSVFDKGFLPNYSDEIFKVVKTIKRHHPVYRLKDLTGEDLEGAWQREEIQKVRHDEDTLYRIKDVLKKRKRRGNVELLVNYFGFPAKDTRWILESEVTSS